MYDVPEVSPAGYYAWNEPPTSERVAANVTLLAAIRLVHQDSGRRHGIPRVHAALRAQAQGRGVSRDRIERLMRRRGIRAIMTLSATVWRKRAELERSAPGCISGPAG